LNNDAELGALGEWAYGAGRGDQHLAYIKVGSGIGAGLLVGGRIYRGASGAAGEIGHVTIDQNGPLCSCGNHGCLEAMAGGKALADQARLAIAQGWRTELSQIQPPDRITAKHIGEAARRGDLLAQQLVATAGIYLGTAIASLINLLNPGVVVVGGGVSMMGDLLLEPIRETVQERSLQAVNRNVRIISAVLGRRASAMGAVVQAVTIALHKMTEKIS
jgi:glucokinase